MISHPPTQDFVAVQGETFAGPAAAAAVGPRTSCPTAKQKTSGIALSCAGVTRKWDTAARAAVWIDGSVSVERSEQDRCEGTRFRAGAFPRDSAEARLCGT